MSADVVMRGVPAGFEIGLAVAAGVVAVMKIVGDDF